MAPAEDAEAQQPHHLHPGKVLEFFNPWTAVDTEHTWADMVRPLVVFYSTALDSDVKDVVIDFANE